MKKLKPIISILRTLLTAIEITDDPVIIDHHFKELISTAEHAKKEIRNENNKEGGDN